MIDTRFDKILLLALAATAACGAARAGQREPTMAERIAAAHSTAENNALCQAVRPFYWSVGDATGPRTDGRVGLMAPGAHTMMSIASASKLIDGAYVVEQLGVRLTDDEVSYLNFTSGYTEFDRCLKDQTVAECQSYQSRRIHNGGYVPENKGRFYYSGGHMQKQATLVGLGPDDNTALAAHINAGLGGTAFQYTQPQLAGGVKTNAAEYGRFLQHIVDGQLKIRALLGTHAVCTNPATCPTAVYSPIPSDESWHYSVGHWVEDDPVVGDGAFSSPGAFGFYPWIDAGKRWWGVLARESIVNLGRADKTATPAAESLYCGRQIRAAWLSGQPR
ncbi:hypothetical protein [Ideonella sp.]|uniref:hypothetical protein n=1 Tax=Ideonella sp. TaxID=1929293 RepID=UPI0035ADE8F3